MVQINSRLVKVAQIRWLIVKVFMPGVIGLK
jgi:hypothetical protein